MRPLTKQPSDTSLPSSVSSQSGIDEANKLKPLPKLQDFRGGSGINRHSNIYNLGIGSAVSKNLRDKIEPTNQSDQEKIARHYAAKKQIGSAMLHAGTGYSLLLEMATHFETPANKATSRAATGYTQKSVGMAGMAYYASKFIENPDPRTAALFVGYALFNAEGFLRMWEGEKSHLPKTGAAAMASASVKMTAAYTMLGTFQYLFDLFANLIESRHGTPRPAKEGFLRALWNLGQSMDKKHIAALQGVAATAMLANAGRKFHEYHSTKPAASKAQDHPDQDHSALDAEFDKDVDAFFNKLGIESESNFHQEVERILRIPEEKKLFDEFTRLVKASRKPDVE